jgi:hypothetical protein
MEAITKPLNSHVPKMLDVRWEEGFEVSLAQAVPDPEVRATLCERLEWVLACRAKAVSAAVPGTGYRSYLTGPAGTGPRIRVFFRIDGELVALIHVEREESGSSGD